MSAFFTRIPHLAAQAVVSFAILGLLAACSHEGPSITGTWKVKVAGSGGTLIANADHTFKLEAPDPAENSSGRWESEGNTVRLWRDIRNGGDVAFGEGGDGAITYTISKDNKTLTAGAPGHTVTLEKQS